MVALTRGVSTAACGVGALVWYDGLRADIVTSAWSATSGAGLSSRRAGRDGASRNRSARAWAAPVCVAARLPSMSAIGDGACGRGRTGVVLGGLVGVRAGELAGADSQGEVGLGLDTDAIGAGDVVGDDRRVAGDERDGPAGEADDLDRLHGVHVSTASLRCGRACVRWRCLCAGVTIVARGITGAPSCDVTSPPARWPVARHAQALQAVVGVRGDPPRRSFSPVGSEAPEARRCRAWGRVAWGVRASPWC